MFIEYLNLITAYLRWALNFLSYYPLSFQKYKLFDVSEIGEKLNIVTNEAHAECAVCLSEVEEGEEIRELRCEHIFHRVCLDRWLDFRQVTCPLCRGCLASQRTPSSHQLGTGVLQFKFSSLTSMDARDRWWLR